MSQVVIYIGVLTEYQGIDILIEAIPLVTRELPDVKFLVVGYPNEDSYRQKARILGVETFVHFTGKIPHEHLPRYLSLADVAVSPKISTTEANLKLFSYLGMALPTVVFDNPINREILGDLGIYAHPGDVKSLAGALLYILRDRDRALEIGRQGRLKATADYSWLAVAKRLTAIYESVGHSITSNRKVEQEANYGKVENARNRGRRFYGFPFSK